MVSQTKKIGGPIHVVMPKSPPVQNRQQSSLDALPNWPLENSDGRYLAITVDVQTSSTARMVISLTGSMAGPSLKGKKVSVAQSKRGMSATAIPAARVQSPPTVQSPPDAMQAQSPVAVVTRAQSLPAILGRAQCAPVMAAFAQSPPPSTPHKPSRRVSVPLEQLDRDASQQLLRPQPQLRPRQSSLFR
ncbi:hypothetical protein FRC04_008351 [Tulasnella sp. 424]|nr:hypothetical protein FRC04_008351 [Tulasnella sp. 424]